MLYRAADAAGHVQLGRHNLAGLAHLPVVRRIASIHRRARCAHSRAKLVGKRRHDFHEFFVRTQGTATRDNDLGRGQLRAVILGNLGPQEVDFVACRHGRQHLNKATAPSGCGRVKTRGANRDDLGGIQALHRGDGITSINRPLKGIRRLDPGHV